MVDPSPPHTSLTDGKGKTLYHHQLFWQKVRGDRFIFTTYFCSTLHEYIAHSFEFIALWYSKIICATAAFQSTLSCIDGFSNDETVISAD